MCNTKKSAQTFRKEEIKGFDVQIYNGVGEKFRSLISSSVLSVSRVVSPRKISRVMQYQDREELRGSTRLDV